MQHVACQRYMRVVVRSGILVCKHCCTCPACSTQCTYTLHVLCGQHACSCCYPPGLQDLPSQQLSACSSWSSSCCVCALQDKLVKTVVANYILWPGAHWINFKYVPTQHRILYNNCVSVSCLAIASPFPSTFTPDPCILSQAHPHAYACTVLRVPARSWAAAWSRWSLRQ